MASVVNAISAITEHFLATRSDHELDHTKPDYASNRNKIRNLDRTSACFSHSQFWNDDLANLAQMWANKCIWDHGFLEFGEMYPNAPFKGQVGMLDNILIAGILCKPLRFEASKQVRKREDQKNVF